MLKRQHKKWVVHTDRPEEIHEIPSAYYTNEEIEKYAHSGGMRRTQEKIACRIINLLDLAKGKILDLGCGVGYTTEVYKKQGFNVIGLDVLPEMLEKARQKHLNVVEGDMRNLKELFREKEFDAVVSASALQWLKAGEDLKKVAYGIYHILKHQSKAVIQFYPKSHDEMMLTAKIFKRQGFEVKIIIDNPQNPIKRVIYLVMEK